MASFVVTPNALHHVADVVLHQRMERPLVTVQWDIGEADLTRAPDGGARWVRAAGHWKVQIIDLVAFEREVREVLPSEDLLLPAANSAISGFDFFLYGRPGNRMLEDCTLELRGEELHVYENAI